MYYYYYKIIVNEQKKKKLNRPIVVTVLVHGLNAYKFLGWNFPWFRYQSIVSQFRLSSELNKTVKQRLLPNYTHIRY